MYFNITLFIGDVEKELAMSKQIIPLQVPEQCTDALEFNSEINSTPFLKLKLNV